MSRSKIFSFAEICLKLSDPFGLGGSLYTPPRLNTVTFAATKKNTLRHHFEKRLSTLTPPHYVFCIRYACMYFYLSLGLTLNQIVFYTEFLSVYSRSHREKSGPYFFILASAASSGERRRLQGGESLLKRGSHKGCNVTASPPSRNALHGVPHQEFTK